MVGIVIVSHSRQLAEGVKELALQMVQSQVPLAIAAGIDDPENPLGTDAMQIQQAIESVYSEAGVIVLMDLGSAIISAEMALEFLSEEQRSKVHLCEAPLVEGAIAAVIAAAIGGNIEQVLTEAKQALVAKAAQLGLKSCSSSAVSKPESQTSDNKQPSGEIRLKVRNKLGLHARPAAKFVATAAQFQSEIRVQNVTRNTPFVRGDSINQVALLGVRQFDELAITAQGSDAAAALAALETLVTANFGEEDTEVTSQSVNQTEVPKGKLIGIPAAFGIAIAELTQYHPTPAKIKQRFAPDSQIQWQRLQAAVQTAKQEIQILRQQTAAQIGQPQAAIFEAHQLILEDPVFIEAVRERIFQQQLTAEAACLDAQEELAAAYRNLEDSYLQVRAVDIIDVGQRVLRQLIGTEVSEINFTQPTILVAKDLTPSDTARLDPSKVLGICTALGSATSHSAILARSRGIPAVVGLGNQILQLANGSVLGLDGEQGTVWIDPASDTITALQAQREQWLAAQQQAQSFVAKSAVTSDNQPVTLLANIASLADAQKALQLGAQGVGLLRTEFLYFNRTVPPSEIEQLEFYRAIAKIMETRPLIIRTLDIGGDKPLPYLFEQIETNPFLGYRGIRWCLEQPELLKTQLRAILQTSFGHQIKVMFPMIATLDEVKAAKAILKDVQAQLRQEGIPFDETMPVGIMIEVPSAVVMSEQLAAEVDFFSIGTNDLSQYVMAADRTNPKVAPLADALHPAVLRMVQQTVQSAHQAGIWVGLCGEIAADPLAVPIWLGLGVDEISVNPQAIPIIKQAIAQITMAQAKELAASALRSFQDSFSEF